MCNPDAPVSFASKLNTPVCETGSPGSRRRRIWELPENCHCPVIGVCLPLHTLRKLMTKVLGAQSLNDYDMHTGAVSVCGSRNRISEVLQRELEQRYAVLIKQFKPIKDTSTLAQRWHDAVEDGDVTGAFWAGLTHPHCDARLQEKMCRDMHMLQHQAGAHARVDMKKMQSLSSENAVLTRELGRIQERITRLVNEKTAEIGKLNTALMQIRAENIRKESEIAFLRSDLANLEEIVPGLPVRVQLVQQIEQLKNRNRELERHNIGLKQQVAQWMHRQEAASASMQPTTIVPDAIESAPAAEGDAVRLIDKTILCVGGRDGNLSTYRQLVECAGGKFEHHDGGREDNLKQLNSDLAAADLVICQTGCISHNAYWRVKDYCKRHGKPCVFVENPSVSGMARSLEALSKGEAVRLVEERI